MAQTTVCVYNEQTGTTRNCIGTQQIAPTPAPSSIATNQVSVGTTSTQVVPARAGRTSLTVTILAANTCAFGNTGVTTATGLPLQPVAGASYTFSTGGKVRRIARYARLKSPQGASGTY